MPDTQVQPKIVQVPSIGNIKFPGDMPDDQISAAIQKNYPQLSPKLTPNPYQQAADKIPGGTGTSMSAGTQTFDQAHPQPQAGALQRFAQGAGIPTSQSETVDAVRGMLNPQADPNEADPLLKKEEQIPVLGGDFRARAALAKRAANETGALSIAHKVASLVPLAGPAVAAAQDEYDKGNYAGAAGAGLNALLSMEGLKSGFTPKAAELPVKSLGADTAEAAARPPVNPQSGPISKSLSTILGGGEKAMAKTPIKQQTAAGNATNLEVAQYAKDNGIDLTPAQATGEKRFQAVQAVGERALLPNDLPERLEQQKAAFGNLLDNFKQRVGTEAIPDTEAAGTSLKSQSQSGLDNLKQSAQADYQGFQQQAGDIPVDLSDVKAKAAASLASQAEALKNVPAQYANPVRNVLKKLSDLQAGPEADAATLKSFNDAVESYGLNPEQQAALRTKLGLPDEAGNSAVKMSTAQQLRSAYLDISRDYSGNVPKSVQRYAGQAAKDIDAAMAKAADQVGATDQWRQANAKWKQIQDTYNNSEHPLYKVLQEPDPSQIPSKLLGQGNYGGSPQTVRQLQQAGINLSPLKLEVTQQIAQNKFAIDNGGNKLGGFSTQFLKALYSPAEFDELTKMGRVSRAIRFEMNTSGTSNVHSAEQQLGGIARMSLKAPLVPWAAAKLTTSKYLSRAAMPGLIERPQPRGLADILGSRGPEPPPDVPPTGAAPVTPPSGPVTPVAPKASGMAAAPRSLSDILSGKPIDPTGAVAARLSELKRELLDAKAPAEKASIQQAIDHLQAVAKGEPFHAPEQAVVENLPASQPREIEPGTYNRETKVHTPGKPQSVNSAVHDVLGEMPSLEHKPTTPQQPMEAGKTVAGNYGNDTAVKTTTGSLPAKYKVVEADSLIPSHNAQTFAKNPQYPEGVQERDYARSKEAQNRVIQQAQNYDPAYTVNTNPDAVNGPPVVTKDGIVLGGNSRTMSTQRLYKAGAGDAYKNSLRLNASQFGVTPAAIDSMKNPVLIREVETPANIEQARRIGADLNKNMTGAMGVGEKAVSAGRSVKPATLQTISGMVNDLGEGATLRDAMRHNGKDIVSMMAKDGVISDRERPQFIDTSTGGLNEEGKNFVERALMGSVVDDPRLMDRVPKSVMGKLEGSLGDLASIGARSDEYNLMPIVREALDEHAEMAMRGLDVNKYLSQGSMFGQAGNPAVEAMTRALAEKPKAFREALKQYAQDAKFDSQGQGLLGIMGKKPSAAQAFNDAFGTKFTDERFHDYLLKSADKEGTINTSGHSDQAAGSNEGVRQASASNAGAGSAGKTSATQGSGKATDQPQAVAQRSLSDILSGKPQEKIDLNAPKSKRKIPPDTTAKADYSGQTVPAKAPTFFSKAERVAEEKLPNSVKADQVIATLQNAGVKADELKWLGLDDYLKGKDKVSKADLLDHIRQNNVQVKEVVKGAPENRLGPDGKPILDGAGGFVKNHDATKFASYQLPGGENYRELLLTLPEDRAPLKPYDQWRQENMRGAKDSPALRDLYSEQRGAANKPSFKSSHFDEPNVLAHVRFNDRISPDGKKTLFLEELQSDWHQKGRKQGYATPESDAKLDAAKKQLGNAWGELHPLLTSNDNLGYDSLGEVKSDIATGALKAEHLDPNDRAQFSGPMQRYYEAYQNYRNAEHNKTGSVPDAPFKSTWHELAMKRMLRYAAENGYDQLAWTTGEQQAARYDLSKQVDHIVVIPQGNGSRAVRIEPNTGSSIKLMVNKDGIVSPAFASGAEFAGKNISDVVGKDIAEKVMGANQETKLSGGDLKVGGSGMKGFYDKILPDFLNKYGKKWGAKVGEANLSDQVAIINSKGDEIWSGSRSKMPPLDPGEKVLDDSDKVHSVPITPAMRKDVIFKGQPIAKNQGPRSLSQILSGSNT